MLQGEIWKNLFTNDLTESRPLILLIDTPLDPGQYGTKILKTVFVTGDDHVEYDKIESRTKAEIMSQINDMLDIMPDRELAAVKFKEIKKLEKKAKKMALIGQFYEKKVFLQNKMSQAYLKIQIDK